MAATEAQREAARVSRHGGDGIAGSVPGAFRKEAAIELDGVGE